MRKVVIAGPVQTQSGYGHHTREIVENFIEQKGSEWDIKLLSLPWGGTPMTFPISMDLQQRIIPLPLREQPDVWVQVSVPNELQAVGKYNIGVTAGTEGDICPEAWLDNLNAMQLVIVPSEFTKKVFEASAIKYQKALNTPIYVIPEYFDDEVYTNKEIKASIPALDDIAETFAFLSVGHWLSGDIGEDRKNVGGLIHRFFETYKNKKNAPALILKSSGATYSVMDRLDIENKINQIRQQFSTSTLPNIYLVHGDLTDAEMNALYNHSKVKALITFTKAEGFGRPLLEFSTTGKPILTPHYSGQVDFLKAEFICALPGVLTNIHQSAQNDWLIGDAKWFTVDYRYAGKMMIDVQENYKKWLELAKRQRYFVNSTFTKTAVTPIYEKVLAMASEVIDKIPKPVQLQMPSLPKLELPTLKKL
jgi:hypothetical protein